MYRVYVHLSGKPAISACACPYVFVDKVAFPAQLANSAGRARVAPTGAATFILKKNAVQFATVEFSAGNPVPTFANMASPVTFAPDDYLYVEAPATPDATLEDLGITLFGERYL